MQSKRNTEGKSSQERSSTDPSQDWVCLKCNNLNFSFRTRCNRCKVQSRYDNRPSPPPAPTNNPSIQEYYYYAQYYYPLAASEPAPKEPQSGKDQQRGAAIDARGEVCGDQIVDGLPSVSRLLKKCKDAAARKGEKREQRQLEWRLFGEEIWNTDEVAAELRLEEKELEWTDDEEASEQFRLSVEKVIV